MTLSEKDVMKSIISDYNALFSDVPMTTHLIEHDVDVGNATPIKQHPYRVNPVKLEAIRTEIKYMLENNIIEHSSSSWSSSCLLVPKLQ